MEHPTPVKLGLHSAKTVPELLVYYHVFLTNVLKKIGINIIFVD